jgi:hypothetical protein
MLLPEYLALKCASASVSRGNIPQHLGLTRINKALRRYDMLMSGKMEDPDLLQRIRESALFGGEECERAISASQHLQVVNRREELLSLEGLARAEFIPHCWVYHQKTIPSPIMAVCFMGIDRFKRIDLPDVISDCVTTQSRLDALRDYLDKILENSRYSRGPFGPAVRVHFRDTYDHAFVYDVRLRRFVSEVHTAPPQTIARWSTR